MDHLGFPFTKLTKANVTKRIPVGADLNNYTAPGLYYCETDAEAITILNAPLPHAFALTVEMGPDGKAMQTAKSWVNGIFHRASIYLRAEYPNWIGGWIPLATATPPEEHDLPLAEGITALRQCTYCKTQDGFVTVEIQAQSASKLAEGITIGTLPSGYRPTKNVEMPCVYYSPFQAGLLRILTNGVITAQGTFSTQDRIFFSLTFRATVI